jgi:hypothetical protein
MGGACGTDGAAEKYLRILVRRPPQKKPFGRRKHRRNDTSKMDFKGIGLKFNFKGIGLKFMNWVSLAQERDQRQGVGFCENGNESWATSILLVRTVFCTISRCRWFCCATFTSEFLY